MVSNTLHFRLARAEIVPCSLSCATLGVAEDTFLLGAGYYREGREIVQREDYLNHKPDATIYYAGPFIRTTL